MSVGAAAAAVESSSNADKVPEGKDVAGNSSHHDHVLAALEHAKAPVMADGFPVDDTRVNEDDKSGHDNMLEFKETPKEVS